MQLKSMFKAKYATGETLIADLEKRILKDYVKRRNEVLEILKTNYAKYLTDVPGADYYTTLAQYNRLKNMEKEIKAVYITTGRFQKSEIIKGQRLIFEEMFYRDEYTMSFFSDKFGRAVKFQPVNPLVRDVSVTGDVELLKQIKNKAERKLAEQLIPPAGNTLTEMLVNNSNEALNKLYATIKQGLINGESYSKQTTRVKKVFDSHASNTAKVIRTEGNRNMNAGSYAYSQELEQAGVRSRRQWVATLDSRTRDSHAQLDGTFEDENGLWHINGDSARYPGDFTDPANSIFCRCTAIDVIEGLEPTVRRGINPLTGKSDILSYQTYDEWLSEMKKYS